MTHRALAPFATTYVVTFAPAYRPCGAPVTPHMTRRELTAERRRRVVRAESADMAVAMVERHEQRMATACMRLPADQSAQGAA